MNLFSEILNINLTYNYIFHNNQLWSVFDSSQSAE